MMHQMLEKYARLGSIAEARFYTTIDGIEISGSPDLLTETTVYDYKTTENPPQFQYPWRSHTEQLMYNAYIARHAEKWDLPDSLPQLPFDPRETPATSVCAVYISPKGPKCIVYETKQTYVTPKGVEREGKRPYVWSDEEVLADIRPKLHLMQEALEIFPRFPDGAEEVWGGQPGWKCPGPPICNFPKCLAKRDPSMYAWEMD
jgi:hypothetical protein